MFSPRSHLRVLRPGDYLETTTVASVILSFSDICCGADKAYGREVKMWSPNGRVVYFLIEK